MCANLAVCTFALDHDCCLMHVALPGGHEKKGRSNLHHLTMHDACMVHELAPTAEIAESGVAGSPGTLQRREANRDHSRPRNPEIEGLHRSQCPHGLLREARFLHVLGQPLASPQYS